MTETVNIERAVYDAYRELESKLASMETKLHRAESLYNEVLQVNRLQLARMNELTLEAEHLHDLLKRRECPHSKWSLIEYRGAKVRQCYYCRILESELNKGLDRLQASQVASQALVHTKTVEDTKSAFETQMRTRAPTTPPPLEPQPTNHYVTCPKCQTNLRIVK